LEADVAKALTSMAAEGKEAIEKASQDFLERHRQHVFRLALAIVGDRDAAEDVTQDALLKCLKNRHRIKTAAAETAWVRQVSVRTALNALRSRRTTTAIPEDLAAESPDLIAVELVLRRLKADHRAILALAVGEQLSYREIALALEIPEGTVASRLAAARREFQKEWEK
jgi:RNA polymerase sigma-70 factor, ECF subfamily